MKIFGQNPQARRTNVSRTPYFIVAGILAVSAGPAFAQSGSMKMPMPMAEGPAHFEPTRQAYTTNHLFLVKLLALPTPIPYQKYFDLRFAVYDGHDPTKRLTDATLTLFAGMRHGLKHGFAHGMQSSPRIEKTAGVFIVSGMFFHMLGPWVLKITVHEGGEPRRESWRLQLLSRMEQWKSGRHRTDIHLRSANARCGWCW
ncbi:hypothetical protein, partial [Acidiphilium iwatense]|uniref:hypothetical protein n=1 Tax=Acidiphilium iwatense TaxID=768198 RepID=UPI001F2B7E7F